MTLSQLEYLLAVVEFGHFGRAAEKLNVTQPTLSMMLKKLEEELDVVLLNRKTKPITLTSIGQKVVQQAQQVVLEANRMQDIVQDYTSADCGHYSVGIIPTAAPYLMPKLIESLQTNYKQITLSIEENQTELLVQKLKTGELDAAILATPIHDDALEEFPLFYEEFFVFGNPIHTKTHLLPTDIDINKLWLLEKGHCLRTQVINLCERKPTTSNELSYQSGSLETLIEIVRRLGGITILPELTALHLSTREQAQLGKFKQPPYREMSLVTHKYSAKRVFIQIIQDIIEEILPAHMLQRRTPQQVIDIYEQET